VKDTAHDSTYSDMLTVLAVSSVVQKPIQTRWPVTVNPREALPFTKLVSGRDLQTVNAVNLLIRAVRSAEQFGNHYSLRTASCGE